MKWGGSSGGHPISANRFWALMAVRTISPELSTIDSMPPRPKPNIGPAGALMTSDTVMSPLRTGRSKRGQFLRRRASSICTRCTCLPVWFFSTCKYNPTSAIINVTGCVFRSARCALEVEPEGLGQVRHHPLDFGWTTDVGKSSHGDDDFCAVPRLYRVEMPLDVTSPRDTTLKERTRCPGHSHKTRSHSPLRSPNCTPSLPAGHLTVSAPSNITSPTVSAGAAFERAVPVQHPSIQPTTRSCAAASRTACLEPTMLLPESPRA
jgi:hypothetical protein